MPEEGGEGEAFGSVAIEAERRGDSRRILRLVRGKRGLGGAGGATRACLSSFGEGKSYLRQ